MIKRITNWLRSIFSSDDQLAISEVTYPVTEEVVVSAPTEVFTEPEPVQVELVPTTPTVEETPVVEAPKPHKPRRRNNRRKKKPVQEQQSQPAPTQAPAPQKQKGRGRPKKNN